MFVALGYLGICKLQLVDWPFELVNKVLLEHRLPIHLSVACDCFYAVTAELRSCD